MSCDNSEEDADEYSIAYRVLSRRRSSPDPVESCPQDQSSSSICCHPPNANTQVDLIINKLLFCISRNAPGDVYSMKKSVQRRKRRMIKSIHPELRCLFQHSSDLFTTASGSPAPNLRPPVPVVDWTKVNERSLGNLPKPQMFPKLGCSDDPNIYYSD